MFLGDKTLVPRINMLCIAVQWSDKYAEASEESSHRLCQESNSKTKMKSENPNTFFIKKKNLQTLTIICISVLQRSFTRTLSGQIWLII